MKFGMMTHIGPPKRKAVKISNFYKSNMADGRQLEKSKKKPYLSVLFYFLNSFLFQFY